MKKFTRIVNIILLVLFAGTASNLFGAPAPYPLVVNSRADSAPPITVFAGNAARFRVTFTDGATASDLTGSTPFLNWATNSASTTMVTSTWAAVSGTTGQVDFAFSPSDLNYTPGRYMYEVGVTSNGVSSVYRQGTFMLFGSPTGGGAAAVTWTTPLNWDTILWSNLPDYATSNSLANEIAFRVAADDLLESRTNDWNSAWQNPAAASDWTWTSDGVEITLTGYSGPNAVVIPDRLDNLPVTSFGEIFKENTGISSVRGSGFIHSLSDNAFFDCTSLSVVSLSAVTTVGVGAFSTCAISSISLPMATAIGANAFAGCESLTSVSLPSATAIGANAFAGCDALKSVSLPAASSIGAGAFYICTALTNVMYACDAPATGSAIYDLAENVINYVTRSIATGWGTTFGDRPVVRMPVYADTVYAGGTSVVARINTASAADRAYADGKFTTYPSVTNIVEDLQILTGALYGCTNASAYDPDFFCLSKIVNTNNQTIVFADVTNGHTIASWLTDDLFDYLKMGTYVFRHTLLWDSRSNPLAEFGTHLRIRIWEGVGVATQELERASTYTHTYNAESTASSRLYVKSLVERAAPIRAVIDLVADVNPGYNVGGTLYMGNGKQAELEFPTPAGFFARTAELAAHASTVADADTLGHIYGSVSLTNGTALIDGVYLGTNAVAFVRAGTNYWIHLP